ncbi:MAG: hypothetical protein PHN79_04605 [Methanoregula sp.]|nr:hypothetical protein [Methanoregula sp.]
MDSTQIAIQQCCFGYLMSMSARGKPAMNTALDISYPWIPVATPL